MPHLMTKLHAPAALRAFDLTLHFSNSASLTLKLVLCMCFDLQLELEPLN